MERAFSKLQLGDRLRVVNNGREAVDYLSGKGEFADRQRFPLPGLILLDVKMPEMSGLEALAWIRAQEVFKAIPTVLFTSSTQQSDVVLSRQLGANAYLVKPSNSDPLASLVKQILLAAKDPVNADSLPGNRISALSGWRS